MTQVLEAGETKQNYRHPHSTVFMPKREKKSTGFIREIMNPVLIENWLQSLDSYIQSTKTGTVYEVVEAMDRSYVATRAFRLMFLTSDCSEGHQLG